MPKDLTFLFTPLLHCALKPFFEALSHALEFDGRPFCLCLSLLNNPTIILPSYLCMLATNHPLSTDIVRKSRSINALAILVAYAHVHQTPTE